MSTSDGRTGRPDPGGATTSSRLNRPRTVRLEQHRCLFQVFLGFENDCSCVEQRKKDKHFYLPGRRI